jgi:hypothetical protein
MTPVRFLILFSFLCLLVVAKDHIANGFPASSFTMGGDGDWYDNWGVDRNYAEGPHGYIPNLAAETLNDNKELAYSIGERFKADYPDEVDRAVAILQFVQKWTEYGYDSDNVIRDGVPQEDWAWNADEMAHAFNETTGVKAIGDCEDMAFLCATIYEGAGIDAAIVDAPGHCACLIWLPQFSNANAYWDLTNDGRDAGWIWVEATGSSNPLGWTPPDFANGDWTAYGIGNFQFVGEPTNPSTSTSIDTGTLLTIIIIIISIIFSILRRL